MKNEIKCPNCGTIIQIDEDDYNLIVEQVRNTEFNNELLKREKELKDKLNADLELNRIKSEASFKEELNNKENEINKLKQSIDNKETEKELAISKAISEKEKQIAELNNKLVLNDNSYIQKENSLKNDYEAKLKIMQEQVEFYKDFKARQSTKSIGESLEVHCHNEFNKTLRPYLPGCYFEKDNEVSKQSGSKGDFIFRDYDEDGNEFVSIMFEMKNEADETENKHKNEYFFKELDKDRKEKKCEYAVLCTMLEPDSDLYNSGIVDVSYQYEKMYVIRPQFFIPIITLIRNGALTAQEAKKQLAIIQNQNLDISNFEENMNQFKEKFSKNYDTASKKFADAIDDIDKTIKALEKTKADLLSSEKNLRLANDKAQELTIKKLTKNAPSVAQAFKDLNK